jgi:hypothetical protein
MSDLGRTDETGLGLDRDVEALTTLKRMCRVGNTSWRVGARCAFGHLLPGLRKRSDAPARDEGADRGSLTSSPTTEKGNLRNLHFLRIICDEKLGPSFPKAMEGKQDWNGNTRASRPRSGGVTEFTLFTNHPPQRHRGAERKTDLTDGQGQWRRFAESNRIKPNQTLEAAGCRGALL